MHARVCSNQCYKKGRLGCTSSCHGCPALHRRTGRLAPHDNPSPAEGHRICPDLTSNHLQSFSSIPLSCSIVLPGLKTTTHGEHCASGKQNEHTCSLYPIH